MVGTLYSPYGNITFPPWEHPVCAYVKSRVSRDTYTATTVTILSPPNSLIISECCRGDSNGSRKNLCKADFKPTVNQFEISPLNTQKELIAYCHQRGIVVSYCGLEEFSKELTENSLLKEIASRHNKTVMQIVFRWMQQQNIVMISKAWDKVHLEEMEWR